MSGLNAFVCYYTEDYSKGVRALRNSHQYWGHNTPLITRKVKTRDESLIERWKWAFETRDYRNVCLLDADMFFENNCDKYFKIPNFGLIAAAHNNAYHPFKRPGDKLPALNLNQITNVPLFIRAGDKILEKVIQLWENDGLRCDFEACNIAFIGNNNRLFTFPPYLWTNIHHTMLKETTRAIMKHSRLMSETNEIINMVHGKFWIEEYVTDLKTKMAEVFHGRKEIVENAFKSANLLKDRYEMYYNEYY